MVNSHYGSFCYDCEDDNGGKQEEEEEGEEAHHSAEISEDIV